MTVGNRHAKALGRNGGTFGVGDVIAVAYGTRVIKARVLDLRETTKKAEAGDLYELVD